MALRTLFSGEIHIDNYQFYVEAGSEPVRSRMNGLAGQVNGLCGAAEPGLLGLNSGRPWGRIGLTIELYGSAPAVGDSWEDVVEVTFSSAAEGLALHEEGVASTPLDIGPGDYRVRYCISGMDDGESATPPPIVCLLQFWPAAPAADRVVRVGSESAAYWHDHARSLGAPERPTHKIAPGRRPLRPPPVTGLAESASKPVSAPYTGDNGPTVIYRS
jgi:hypothetical protein